MTVSPSVVRGYRSHAPSRVRNACLGVLALLFGVETAEAQLQGVTNGEWRYLGGDAGHTRYSPLQQINASNFEDLRVAWVWRGDNFGPGLEYTMRSTPSYVDGRLYTVAGQRRQVVSIDPGTGETVWSFREPNTTRYWRSPRADFGKGIAYGEVDGRGVIFINTPGFFLWALDARTGRPLEGWGAGAPDLPDFPDSGVIDLLPDLLDGWGPWQDYVSGGGTLDADYGIPRELGMITASSPPIVVNDVVVVTNAHEPSYGQTRMENVPGDILAYDTRSGTLLWKFHVIPRPGEFGHDTWESDAWRFSGDVSSWVPASADPELGLVYLVLNASTVETFAGHRPGHNLFGGSIVALDVRTGERRWHFQVHRSDKWNYDIPATPILMDLTVDGERVPALVQNTKQGLIFALNRETGEPLWPVEERPVVQTEVPGDYTSPTQPYPTRPEPVDGIILNGITDEFVIDYTPELKAHALEILADYPGNGLYMPNLPYNHGHDFANYIGCRAGLNIYHPAVADPTTGIMYISHNRECNAPPFMVPTDGVDEDRPDVNPVIHSELRGAEANWRGRERTTPTTGTTVAPWRPGGGGGVPRIQGLPVWKPLNQALSAYDMNTGERLWSIPIGETPEEIRNHPLLEGVDIPNTGGTGFSIQIIMGDILVQTTEDLRGETEVNENGMPMLHARDKRTGEILGSLELPMPGQYGMMTYMYEGRQYLLLQAGSARRGQPGSLMALRLP